MHRLLRMAYASLIVLALVIPASVQGQTPTQGAQVSIAATSLDERMQGIGYNCNRAEYLAIWQVDNGNGNTDLWARRAQLRPFFQWIGNAFPVANSPLPEKNAAVVFNPSDEDFLVVYEYRSGAGDYDVYGQRVRGIPNSGNELKGGAFGIGVTVGNETEPDVAYMPGTQQFLVAYNLDSDIWGRRVARENLGTQGGQLIGDEFIIAADLARRESDPAVAAGTLQSYFVVTYTYDFLGNGSDLDIWGQRVRGTYNPGNELLSAAFDMASTPAQEQKSDLAYSQEARAFVGVWQASAAGNDDVNAVWLNENTLSGDPAMTAIFPVSADLIALESSPAVDVDPSDGSVLVALSWSSLPGAMQQLGLAWLNPLHVFPYVSRPLAAYPPTGFNVLQPVARICHSQPGVLVGYSGRADANPNTPQDAYLLATARYTPTLPLILR